MVTQLEMMAALIPTANVIHMSSQHSYKAKACGHADLETVGCFVLQLQSGPSSICMCASMHAEALLVQHPTPATHLIANVRRKRMTQ
jgi:hypothetical protein